MTKGGMITCLVFTISVNSYLQLALEMTISLALTLDYSKCLVGLLIFLFIFLLLLFYNNRIHK